MSSTSISKPVQRANAACAGPLSIHARMSQKALHRNLTFKTERRLHHNVKPITCDIVVSNKTFQENTVYVRRK